VVYSDDHACPVMVQKRLKKERRTTHKASLSSVLGKTLERENDQIGVEVDK